MSEMQLHDLPSDVSPSTSRIELWRQSIEPVSPPSPLPKHHTSKRKRQALYDTDPAPAKRITRGWRGNNPLQPISGNMTSPNRKLSLRQTRQKTPSPSKRQARQQTNGGVQDLDNEQVQATPRPRGRPRRLPNPADGADLFPLQPPNGAISGGDDPSDDGMSSGEAVEIETVEGSEARTIDSKSSRSRAKSPVKTKAEMLFARVPTEFGRLDGKSAREAGGFLTTYTELRDIMTGMAVIPASLQEVVEKYVDKDDWPQANCYAGLKSTRYDEEIWRRVLEVHKKALDCELGAVYEVKWNSDVHGPLLDLVVGKPLYEGAVANNNVTSARIQPKKLFMQHVNGGTMENKMVDFAITLKFGNDTGLMDRTIQYVGSLKQDEQTLNQTFGDALMRCEPIFLNIETKTPFAGGDTSDIQLAVWGGAGLTKIEDLLSKSNRAGLAIPTMPIITIHGHDWHLCSLQRKGGKTLSKGKIHLGSTATVLGIFQIIKALDTLVTWGNTTYRKWFVSNILTPKLAKK